MINELTNEMIDTLVEKAHEMQQMSHCPYSGFAVGAALLSEDGKMYTGCNIENVAFGPSICAERTAIVKAVSEGIKNFTAIAIVGGKNREIGDLCYPCGVCRQVMTEFCKRDFKIITRDRTGKTVIKTLEELLPESFTEF